MDSHPDIDSHELEDGLESSENVIQAFTENDTHNSHNHTAKVNSSPSPNDDSIHPVIDEISSPVVDPQTAHDNDLLPNPTSDISKHTANILANSQPDTSSAPLDSTDQADNPEDDSKNEHSDGTNSADLLDDSYAKKRDVSIMTNTNVSDDNTEKQPEIADELINPIPEKHCGKRVAKNSMNPTKTKRQKPSGNLSDAKETSSERINSDSLKNVTQSENEMLSVATVTGATASELNSHHIGLTTTSSAQASNSLGTTTGIASIPLAHGLPPGIAYQPFTSLQTSTPLMGTSLVSMPIQGHRRAVPIRPMGVIPLPPHGAVAPNLIPDLQRQSNPELMAAAAAVAVAAGLHNDLTPTNVGISAPGTVTQTRNSSTVGEMVKGKRRGLSSGVIISNDALTPEERTKQKRMLRNRESAARSRDKKKLKNKELEISIEKHKAKRAVMEKCIADLSDLVTEMKTVLKKHNITI